MVLLIIVALEDERYIPVALPVIIQPSIRLVELLRENPSLLLFLTVHPVIVGALPLIQIPLLELCSMILSVTVIEAVSRIRAPFSPYPEYRITTLSNTLFTLLEVKYRRRQSPRAGVLALPSPFVSPPTVSSLREVK